MHLLWAIIFNISNCRKQEFGREFVTPSAQIGVIAYLQRFGLQSPMEAAKISLYDQSLFPSANPFVSFVGIVSRLAALASIITMASTVSKDSVRDFPIFRQIKAEILIANVVHVGQTVRNYSQWVRPIIHEWLYIIPDASSYFTDSLSSSHSDTPIDVMCEYSP